MGQLCEYKEFQFNKIDITKKNDLENLFKKNKFDLVINLAAQAGVRLDSSEYQRYFDANVIGFFNVVDLCNKYNSDKLLYASSSSVYGALSSKTFSRKILLTIKNHFIQHQN